MPLHQISVIPRDVTSSRGSGSSGKAKDKDKDKDRDKQNWHGDVIQPCFFCISYLLSLPRTTIRFLTSFIPVCLSNFSDRAMPLPCSKD
ncbi:hypothetical protein Baya_15084 [Bagarius yarrelli]|uniref:Uncharacterized protein n=1 Tax=Bagarius yarrelli TaxID=175774 RepID=A0A556VBD8_BAGYA|nr:hypothetical protein Baya_15084 [Bagarius yarrelli]